LAIPAMSLRRVLLPEPFSPMSRTSPLFHLEGDVVHGGHDLVRLQGAEEVAPDEGALERLEPVPDEYFW